MPTSTMNDCCCASKTANARAHGAKAEGAANACPCGEQCPCGPECPCGPSCPCGATQQQARQ